MTSIISDGSNCPCIGSSCPPQLGQVRSAASSSKSCSLCSSSGWAVGPNFCLTFLVFSGFPVSAPCTSCLAFCAFLVSSSMNSSVCCSSCGLPLSASSSRHFC